jgi:hypothetical protein
MLGGRIGLTLTCLTAAALTPVFPALAVLATSAQQPGAYSVEVSDVFAKVGEHAVMHVTLRLRDGYKVLEAYTNRLGRFSSFDGGVAFDNKMVSGAVQDNTLVFTVGVTPTKPGRHPINGVFRVGYIENSENMSEVSVPLIANVTGTQ